MISLRPFLSAQPVHASAPCRIDAGGTWDIKALALPLAVADPVTFNAALTLRTTVSLGPYRDGWVRVISRGFSRAVAYPVTHMPLDSPFGIFLAAVAHYAVHGLEIRIASSAPVRAGLGGSSTALVALLKALNKVSADLQAKAPIRKQILHLGYHLEDAVSGGQCGQQDQAAAVYGGVNLWRWRYADPVRSVGRVPLLDARGRKAFSERLLVAYSGQSHVAARTNRRWIRGFLSGKTRTAWVEANAIVHDLAGAVRAQAWEEAARLVRRETALRREMTPEALIPLTRRLLEQAEAAGCGARFTGAGAGGSVWAIGRRERIEHLRMLWEKTLREVRGAGILPCAVDARGVY